MRGFILYVMGGAVAVTVLVFGIMQLAPAAPSSEHLAWRPQLHALLNGTCAALLTIGYFLIRRRLIRAHLVVMLLAALASGAFLASYLDYHAQAGSRSFEGQGAIRLLYFAILLSHTVLAAIVAPMAAAMFFLAAQRKFDLHRRLGRWTLPLWLYVSVTGVLIYLMLYVWYPHG